MTGSDVFLTGATGYVGPAVLAALRASGRSVTALVREPTELGDAETVVGYLGALSPVLDHVTAAGSVVHLASNRSTQRELVVYEDILGTGELLDAWTHGPFVYGSTSTIHGVPAGMLGPASAIHIEDWYDCGKVICEFQVRDAARAGINGRGPGISLRPTLYFGPSHRAPVRQYLGWFLGHVTAGHSFAFFSEEALETAGAAYIGLDDYGRAVVAALDRGETGAYPVAGGFVTWRDLVAAIDRAAGTTTTCVVRPDDVADSSEIRVGQSRTELDSSAFMGLTGWAPQQSLDELVGAFVRGEQAAGRA
jgi:nucleoside-diphosphate-sugar epimerase